MTQSESKNKRRLAAILTVDTVGYSRLMEADEAGTLARVKAAWRNIFYPRISEFGGRVVKTLGDGLLCEFHSAASAAECAIQAQTAVEASEGSGADQPPLRFRIGIHLGDVIVDGDDLFGDGVNVSARLEGLVAPGGICISAVTRDMLSHETADQFEFGGEKELKNISRAVRLWHWPAGTVEARAQEAGKKSSIAVLPFGCFGSDLELEGLADGLADAVTSAFSRRTGFDVIAHGLSARFKDRAGEFEEIRDQLGARYVLTGTLRRSGKRVRITAELSETITGTQLWSERYDRDLEDVFELQDELTDRIAIAARAVMNAYDGRLVANKPDAELTDAERLTKSAEHFYRRTRDDFEAAERQLDIVLKHDPKNHMATSMQGLCLYFSINFGVDLMTEERAARAWDLVRRGVQLNPASDFGQAAHSFLALHLKGDHDTAIQAARRGVELSPQYGIALALLGESLSLSGNPEEGIPIIRKAMESGPKNLADFSPWRLATSCFVSGDYPMALKAIDRAIQAVQDMPPLHYWKAAILVMLGDVDEAKVEIDNLRASYPDFGLSNVQVQLFKRNEDRDRLLDALRTAGVPE